MTKKASNYLLSIDVEQDYDVDKLKKKLDTARDWLRIVPGTYFIHSIKNHDEWYEYLKKALPNTRFFLTKIDISKGEYVGWLAKDKWTWIKEQKSK